MEIKDTVDPVGTVVQDELVGKYVENIKVIWDNTNPSAPWWQFWNHVNFIPVVNFLINCIDDLVSYFMEHNIPGADKKATVLAAVGLVYDHIAQKTFPVWLWPFSPVIRHVVVDMIISSAIDWIVTKYKNGNWRPNNSVETLGLKL